MEFLKKLNKVLIFAISGLFVANISMAALGDYWITTKDIIPRTNQAVDIGSSSYKVKSGIFGNITFTTSTINGVNYIWPSTAGTNNYVLSTNGSGTLNWVAQTGGGGSGSGIGWSWNNVGLIYPTTSTDVVAIGSNATTAIGYILDVTGNVKIGSNLLVNGTSHYDGDTYYDSSDIVVDNANIRVLSGNIYSDGGNLYATSGNAYLGNIGGQVYLGDVMQGNWYASRIKKDFLLEGYLNQAYATTTYLTKTGNLLGTLNGYFQNSFLHSSYATTTFLKRADYFSSTTNNSLTSIPNLSTFLKTGNWLGTWQGRQPNDFLTTSFATTTYQTKTGNFLGTFNGYFQNSFLHTTYASSTYLTKTGNLLGTWKGLNQNDFLTDEYASTTYAKGATLPLSLASGVMSLKIGNGLSLSSTSSLFIASNAISDAMVVDTITASNYIPLTTTNWVGTLNGYFQNSFTNQVYASSTYVWASDWTTIDNYPAACAAGQYVSGIGDTLTCSTPPSGSGGGGISGWTWSVGKIYNTTSTDKVGIGTSTPNALLSVGINGRGFVVNEKGSATSTDLAISRLLNCDTIDTDASGNLKCGTDAGTAYTANSPLVLTGTDFDLNIGVGLSLSSTSSLFIANNAITDAMVSNILTASSLGGYPQNAFLHTTYASTTYANLATLPLSLSSGTMSLKIGSGLSLSATSSLFIANNAITDAMVSNILTASSLGGYPQNSFVHSAYATTTYQTKTGNFLGTFNGYFQNSFVNGAYASTTFARLATLPLSLSSGTMSFKHGAGLTLSSTSSLYIANNAITDAMVSNTLTASNLGGYPQNSFVHSSYATSTFLQRSSYFASTTITYIERCATFASTTFDKYDNVPLWHPYFGITVIEERCYSTGGTSVQVTISDGTNNMDTLTCATSITKDSSLSNNTWVADELMEIDFGTNTGSSDYVEVCIIYRKDLP